MLLTIFFNMIKVLVFKQVEDVKLAASHLNLLCPTFSTQTYCAAPRCQHSFY